MSEDNGSASKGAKKGAKAVGGATQTAMDSGNTELAGDSEVDQGLKTAGGEFADKTDITSAPYKIDKVGESTPVKLPDPDYLSNFCRNRNMPPKDSGMKDIVKGLDGVLKIATIHTKFHDYIGTAILGVFLILFIIWNLIKYKSQLIPFAKGGFNIFKFLLIYTIIIILIVLFFKFTSYFSFWYVAFVKYFKLFYNPLLNDKVSFLYCYLTDYINWIIYYSAKIFYLIILIGLLLLLLLFILPLLAIVSFAVGYLFSLIGEKTSQDGLFDKMKKTAQIVTGKPAPNPVPTPPPSAVSNLLSKLPIDSSVSNLLSKLPIDGAVSSLISKLPIDSDMISKLPIPLPMGIKS